MEPWLLALLVLVAVAWGSCGWVYKLVHGRPLRWWALPFAHGALLFGRRLKEWER